MPIPAVRFDSVSRHFGEVKAVDQVDLEIQDGEFFSMLGPSGSGKTTCLRMIAGFDRPTMGTIQLYGQDVSNLPPFERDVNTVFQDYALFPYMTIEENIAYGLTIKGVPKPERIKRVDEMLDLVQLPGFGYRKPSQLSGGQRQRVTATALPPTVTVTSTPMPFPVEFPQPGTVVLDFVALACRARWANGARDLPCARETWMISQRAI